MKGFFLQSTLLFLVFSSLSGQAFKWETKGVDQPLPCQDPQIQVKMEPTGFCEGKDRPAVLIECLNCNGVNWNYSVEVRTETGTWQALNSNGLRDVAFGNDPHTEPLCLPTPGTYFVQVLAWGANCTTPVAWVISTPAIIGDVPSQNVFSYNQQPSPSQQAPASPTTEPAIKTPPPPPPTVTQSPPQTCRVKGAAQLNGLIIRGTLSMEQNSPCRQLNPYANLSYKSPDHPDIVIKDIPLEPGIDVPFEFQIPNSDLNRSVHPIDVTVYAGTQVTTQQVPLASFWMNAASPGVTSRGNTKPLMPPSSISDQVTEAFMQETFDTIGVVASDPNCTQIQELQLVYHPTQPNEPLYLSWLSPRCCQEQGCEYSVWMGSSPEKLRLLVTGTKPGAIIREILPDVRSDDTYYEVVVNTSNGVRKAAFAQGEGPIYGLEAVMAYRDRSQLPNSDSQVYPKNAGVVQETASGNTPPTTVQPYQNQVSNNELLASSSTAFALNNTQAASSPSADPFIGEGTITTDPEVMQLVEPVMSIRNFGPCQYQRKTTISGDLPVKPGEQLSIIYDHSRDGHQYTLYFLPEQTDKWVIAPGTQELQSTPVFNLDTRNYHAGKYLILTYKATKNWGCLSAPFTDAIEVDVKD